MLQRAASNAYSWWWASHIRTKQSKWLEQSLQDMEEKVAETLKIIDDDGDSFAKRAEMYYRKRPELIAFVEESFKAYRALAERYDHISKELQSANRTVASVFPDRVQYQMEEDDEEEIGQGAPTSPSNDPNNSTQNKTNIPKVPKTPKKDFRSPSMLLSRKGPLRRLTSSSRHVSTPISGLSKAEALSEIDRLQKDILALQTEKEFVRSLYERAYNKYWEIEDQITETQKRVCSLQDEFGIGTVIEDDDARTLMAATALRSCNETLAKLKEIQAKSSIEAKVEYQRVKDAHEKFEKLRDEFISKHMSHQDICDWNKSDNLGSEHRTIDEDMARMDQETHDMGLLREKIKEKLELDSNSSLTVTEMAERIDELVNKVVTLETAVSSQDALVRRLRSETDELQKHIQNLEEEKEMLIASSDNMNKKLKELAEELKKVKDLNRNVRHQDNSLQTHFTEATCNLEHLSGRLQNVKPDEETENLVLYKKKSSKNKPGKQSEEHRKLSVDDSAILDDFSTTNDKKEDNAANLINNANLVPGRIQKLIQQEKDYKEDLSDTVSAPDIESQDLGAGEEDQPNWRQMFINSLDDREKILLEEYTSVLLNYKDVRAKLNDVEKKNRDSIFELALQVRELKGALATKDKEIHFLHHKLNGPESNPDESPFTTYTEYKYTPQEGLFQGSAEASNLQDPDVASQYLDAKAARTSAAEQNVEITGIIGISSGNLKDISRKENLLKVRLNQVDNRQGLSNLEKKFRSDIDDLLEENLEFWLRFSTSVHQIQKFQNSIQDLQAELFKIKNKNRSEGNSTARQQWMQSEMRPIFRHMREIRTELSLWLEHNAVLQDELQGRYSSLCNIQDDITRASSNADSEAEKAELSGYQAAKFQGEILNMKQENNKVASELQAGLSLVKGLKNEVEKTLAELDEALGINKYNQPRKKDSSSRARIPLRSFLFGVKLKKQKQSSLFACVNPTLQKQYSDLAAASNLPIERETD